MANVENHAALARRGDLLAHAAVGRGRSVGERAKTMGEDVAAPQPRHHFEPRWRWMVEMRHHRQSGLRGDLERHVEWGDAGIAAGGAPDPNLDPDDEVAIGVDDAHA